MFLKVGKIKIPSKFAALDQDLREKICTRKKSWEKPSAAGAHTDAISTLGFLSGGHFSTYISRNLFSSEGPYFRFFGNPHLGQCAVHAVRCMPRGAVRAVRCMLRGACCVRCVLCAVRAVRCMLCAVRAARCMLRGAYCAVRLSYPIRTGDYYFAFIGDRMTDTSITKANNKMNDAMRKHFKMGQKKLDTFYDDDAEYSKKDMLASYMWNEMSQIFEKLPAGLGDDDTDRKSVV